MTWASPPCRSTLGARMQSESYVHPGLQHKDQQTRSAALQAHEAFSKSRGGAPAKDLDGLVDQILSRISRPEELGGSDEECKAVMRRALGKMMEYGLISLLKRKQHYRHTKTGVTAVRHRCPESSRRTGNTLEPIAA
jgi:hypothetical protein